jgi:uncharacterized protein with von Willebrand factor type A (vWA) domain
LKWLKQNLPQVSVRLHGLGFQGPLLLLIPAENFKLSYQALKRQFYESSLTEIQIVNTPSKVFII